MFPACSGMDHRQWHPYGLDHDAVDVLLAAQADAAGLLFVVAEDVVLLPAVAAGLHEALVPHQSNAVSWV